MRTMFSSYVILSKKTAVAYTKFTHTVIIIKAGGGNMYRILICDDEKDIRESTADYMKSEGLSVALAADGYEAVEKCKEESFDLIV